LCSATEHPPPQPRERSDECGSGLAAVALASAFAVLGRRWNGVLLGSLADPAGRRFAELRAALAPISDSMLSQRLRELTGSGLVQRSVTDGPPIEVSYALTTSGRAVLPALQALGAWAAALPPASRPGCST
jgi:DNA-binding HxlR family transcriptional regulator